MRIRETGAKVSTETAYIVTSLTAAEAGPERLLYSSALLAKAPAGH